MLVKNIFSTSVTFCLKLCLVSIINNNFSNITGDKMKTIILFLLFMSCFALSENRNTNLVLSNDYYPLTKGTTWTYLHLKYYSLDQFDTMWVEIIGTQIIAEKEYLDYILFFTKNYSTYIGSDIPSDQLPNPQELLSKVRKERQGCSVRRGEEADPGKGEGLTDSRDLP